MKICLIKTFVCIIYHTQRPKGLHSFSNFLRIESCFCSLHLKHKQWDKALHIDILARARLITPSCLFTVWVHDKQIMFRRISEIEFVSSLR